MMFSYSSCVAQQQQQQQQHGQPRRRQLPLVGRRVPCVEQVEQTQASRAAFGLGRVV